MKNVYIIDDYSSSKINGIGTYIKELLFCLKGTGMNICQIECFHETKTFKMEMINGIKQIQFPKIINSDIQYYSIIDKFLRLYIQDSYENVFFFNHTPNEFFVKTVKISFPLSKLIFVIHDMVWTASMLGDESKMKKYVVVQSRELFAKEYPELLSNFENEKGMYETVQKIIALSLETIEFLQRVYNIDNQKITFISNGLRDTDRCNINDKKIQLRTKLLIPLHEKLIVFAGRVREVKGIYRVVSSLKNVAKTYLNFRLIVIGTVFEMKKMMEYAGEIVTKITFTGQISKERLNEWYQIADMGVLASYWEQCSYTGIEMMMHGLPVVASDGFCVGDMFKDGINAKVARIGDRNNPDEFENNLTEAFLELLQSPELCEKLGRTGREMYESKYHINNMKEGYRKLLNSLDCVATS